VFPRTISWARWLAIAAITIFAVPSVTLGTRAAAGDAEPHQALNTLNVDAQRAGLLQAYRYLLKQHQLPRVVPAGQVTALDLAADQLVHNLMNKYYDYGPIGQAFTAEANKTAKAIVANPAQYRNQLSQIDTEVQTEAQHLIDGAKQEAQNAPQNTRPAPTYPTTTTSNPPTTTANPPGGPRGPQGPKPQPQKSFWDSIGDFFHSSPRTVTARQPSEFPTGELILLLLILGAGAAGYQLFLKNQGTAEAAAFADLKASMPATPPRLTPPPVAPPTGSPKSGSVKEQMFASQKEKYQYRYNAIADQVTAAGAALAQMQGVIDGVQNNLKTLGKVLQRRVQRMVVAQYTSPGDIIKGALTARPVFRLSKNAGGLLKLVVLIGVAALAIRLARLVYNGDIATAVIEFLLVFAVFFFAELFLRLKEPLAACSKNAAKFNDMSLAYVYDEATAQMQGTALSYPVLRVMSAGKNPPYEEFPISATSWGSNIRRDSFLLYVGDMAVYRIERNGNCALISFQPNDAATGNFCQLTSTALSEQKSFATATLEPLISYARAVWRQRRAAEDAPRLAGLIQDVSRIENVWRDTYTSDAVFEFLERRIDLFNMRDPATPPGILLYGYEGNGKAYLAKKVADCASARLEQVNIAAINSEKEVRALWERSRGKNPVVLYLDYAERVFAPPGGEFQSAGSPQATVAWLSEWGKMEPRDSRVWVIMTAKTLKALHPSIVDQFGSSKIEIVAPETDAGREMVLRNACRDNQMQQAVFPPSLLKDSRGCSIRDLRRIVTEVKMQCNPGLPNEAHWQAAVKIVRGGEGIAKDTSKNWDTLIVPNDVKTKLKVACQGLKEADLYKERKIRLPAILLAGPAGTGKTEVARTIAAVADVPCFEVGVSDIKGQYEGFSAQNVANIFAKAREKAPSVLFIDEFESMVGKRDAINTDSFSKDIVTQINREMDGAAAEGRTILVMAATNFVEQMDKAIVSRFQKIDIPLPDEDGRRQILKVEIQRQAAKALEPGFSIDEITADLAKRTPDKSGRNLRDLVGNAIMRDAAETGSIGTAKLKKANLYAEIGPQTRPLTDIELDKLWAGIVLKPEIKNAILAKIKSFNRGDKTAPAGLLLYGPPGTGKSEIANLIAKSTGSYPLNLVGSDMKKGFQGQSGQATAGIWEQALAHVPCIMFIDECDAVFQSIRSVETDQFVKDIVEQFKASWQPAKVRGKVWVVGATNHKELIDEAILSRFGDMIEIPTPDAPQRRQILQLEMKKAERDWPVPEFVGEDTSSYSGRDLVSLIAEVCTVMGDQPGPPSDQVWKNAVKRFVGSTSDAVDPDAHWGTLVVSDTTMRKLKSVCTKLQNFALLQKQGIEMPTGILLYGPPGTGKTRIASTLANESGVGFVSAKPADLKGAYLGHSGPKVIATLARARTKAPCILFIDEIDTVTSQSGVGDQINGEIIGTFKAELGGITPTGDKPVFLVAAANHPETMDEAVLSRFTERILIPNPNEQQRCQLLKILLAKPKKDFDVDAVAAEIAARVGEVSGRDLKNLVKRAFDEAVDRAAMNGTLENIVLSRQDLLGVLASSASA
jgi:SpoVK/Ycf46/Vps4 family AAA+-type ATPase